MELIALLRRGGWVDSVPSSGSVGRRFKSRQWNFSDANSLDLFTHNYSGQISQLSFRVDKLATVGAESQSPFAYSPIQSTLSYNFKILVHFLDEGKFWYHFLALSNLKERAPNLSKTSASAGTMNHEKSAHAALAIVLLLLCSWLLIRVQVLWYAHYVAFKSYWCDFIANSQRT